MRGEDVLVSELRGLFRHAPLSPTDLLTHAPNLSRTLDLADPESAMVKLWDIFDEFPGDKYVGAAAAALGLTRSGNVLDRMVDFAPEKNPRTVRRWAYDGVDKVITEIARRFHLIYAIANLRVSREEDVALVSWSWVASDGMPPPSVERWDLPYDMDAEIIETTLSGDEVRIERRDTFKSWLVLLNWTGEAVPTWGLSSNTPLSAYATISSFSVECAWD